MKTRFFPDANKPPGVGRKNKVPQSLRTAEWRQLEDAEGKCGAETEASYLRPEECIFVVQISRLRCNCPESLSLCLLRLRFVSFILFFSFPVYESIWLFFLYFERACSTCSIALVCGISRKAVIPFHIVIATAPQSLCFSRSLRRYRWAN